jgi:hypothetical protein
MAVRKATNKAHNKKLRRRREGLSSKCFEYGELDGAELALFIHYPKRGDFYSYMSKQTLPWLNDVPAIVSPISLEVSCNLYIDVVQTSHPKARIEYPDDLRARVDDARKKMKMTKDADASTIVDDDTPSARINGQPILLAFPDFECNLSILAKQINSRWRAAVRDDLQ